MAQSSATSPQEWPVQAAPIPPRCSNPQCYLHLDPRVGRQPGRSLFSQGERKDPNALWVRWASRKAGGEQEAQGWRRQIPKGW